MTAPVPHRMRLHLVMAVAAGAVLLGLSACTTSNAPAPKYPIYMQEKPGDTAPAAEAPPADQAPTVIAPPSGGGITATELPPPPPPPPPVETTTPAAGPVAAAPVSGAPVKDTRAAYVYTMVAQDTLYGISRRFGVPVKSLFEINGFEPEATLRIGQKVLLPEGAVDKGADSRANGAAMVRLSAALASTTPAPKPVEPKPVAANPVTPVASTPAPVTKPTSSLPPPVVTKPASTPAKPAVTAPVSVSAKPTVTSPAIPAATTPKPVAAAPTPVVKPAPVAKPATVTPPPPVAGFPTNAQLSQMGRNMFAWPVKGKVVVPFGQLAPNVRNDGINIASTTGTDVVAAADGIVVYQGDQVKELGNTIYIKHANGWYTGYSHLSGMKVANNQKVTKGQVIGAVGQTGTIDQPQLHFEVRYTPSTDIARPIDPRLVLP